MNCPQCNTTLEKAKITRIEIIRHDDYPLHTSIGWQVKLLCPNCLVMSTKIGEIVPVVGGSGALRETMISAAESHALHQAEEFLSGVKQAKI